MTFNSIIKYHS